MHLQESGEMYLETILILDHHLIFPFETAYDTSSYTVEETYLISYIHPYADISVLNLGANLRKNPHIACVIVPSSQRNQGIFAIKQVDPFHGGAGRVGIVAVDDCLLVADGLG